MAVMTRTEFIEKMETLVQKMKKGEYDFINLEAGYIFANQHYGEIQIPLTVGTSLSVKLFTESEEKKEKTGKEVDEQ